MRVLDISTPAAPREIASYKIPSYADQVWVSDGTAYVAAYDAGMMIMSLEDEHTYISAHHPEESMQSSK